MFAFARAVLCAFALICAAPAFAQESQTIALWPNGAPGFEVRRDEPELAQDWWVRNIHNPSLTAFLPTREIATGTAVIVVPGGGHREVVFGPEGEAPARYFQAMGVAAFALKYRLAFEQGSPYTIEHSADDLRRAIRLVRARAAEFGIDANRIGVMGWSAGGELASMVSYGPHDGLVDSLDPVDRVSARPDFQIVIYPGPYGVPTALNDPPPAFFLAAFDDESPADTITRLLGLYRQAGVRAEAHLFARGGHAFNMGERSDLRTIHDWPRRMADWMSDSGLLTKQE